MSEVVYSHVIINNVDIDGLIEVIVYGDSYEKIFQCKVKDFFAEILHTTSSRTPVTVPIGNII